MMLQTKLLALVASTLLFTATGVIGRPQDTSQANPPVTITTGTNTTGTNVTIGTNTTVGGNTTTGDNTTVGDNTTTGGNTTVGDNTTTGACPGTVVDIIQKNPNLTILNRWIQQEPIALRTLCNQSSNYTVFAPTDSAFSEFPAYLRAVLARPEARTERALILGYHIYPGNLVLSNVTTGNPLKLKTLIGSEVTVERTNVTSNDTNNGTLDFGLGTYRVNGVNVVAPVANSTNGEVVPIDLVLDPSDSATYGSTATESSDDGDSQ